MFHYIKHENLISIAKHVLGAKMIIRYPWRHLQCEKYSQNILTIGFPRYKDCYMAIPVTQAKYYVEHNEANLSPQIILWHSSVV